MSTPDSFDEVIGRLCEGDQQAAAEIFRRFVGRLIPFARNRLSAQVRGKIDPEDVLQSVFRSFFIRHADGQFELEDWDGLWSLLVRITFRKCGRRIAAFAAGRRDVRREVSPLAWDEEARRQWEAIARDPMPEEAASLAETLEHLLRGLDERQRQIVTLRLQGFMIPEISQEVERTERTVHRVLAHVRERLKYLEGQVH
jgi:RNA polymerase sigma-70 factor (ECF subfamily)